MGVRGLLSAASTELQFHRSSFFKNSYFYIDGLNFTSNLANRLKSGKKEGVYEDYIGSLDKQIKILQSFEPRQIEFYFDAYYPISKAPLRAQRKTRYLKELNAHRQLMHKSILSIKHILSEHKSIKVIYTGLEAEDQIIKTINDRQGQRMRHVVFSSDSDLFTFKLPNAGYVEIVPLMGHRLRPKGLDSINVANVQNAEIIAPSLMRPVPEQLEGKSIYAVRPMSSLIDFLNAKKAHGFCKKSLPLIYSPANVDPHDAALDIRRAAYGLLFLKWYDGVIEPVTEVFQSKGEITSRVVQPLEGAVLDDCRRIMTTCTPASIIQNQLEVVAEKYNLTEHDLMGVYTYINDLELNSKIRMSDKLSAKVDVLFPLLKAVLTAIMFWEEVLGGVIQKSNIVWRISPYELESYM